MAVLGLSVVDEFMQQDADVMGVFTAPGPHKPNGPCVTIIKATGMRGLVRGAYWRKPRQMRR